MKIKHRYCKCTGMVDNPQAEKYEKEAKPIISNPKTEQQNDPKTEIYI